MKSQSKPRNESKNRPNDALRLLYFRSFFDLNQQQMADLLNVPKSSYRAYEKGRFPVSVYIRRKVGSLSPVELLPMDPNQDPKNIYTVVRSAHPDDFCEELKALLPDVSSVEQMPALKEPETIPLIEGRRELRLLGVMRKNRALVKAKRQAQSSSRRIYSELRDAGFFASSILLLSWIICLQLNIPLGVLAETANKVGSASLIMFFMLAAAVFQDNSFHQNCAKASYKEAHWGI